MGIIDFEKIKSGESTIKYDAVIPRLKELAEELAKSLVSNDFAFILFTLRSKADNILASYNITADNRLEIIKSVENNIEDAIGLLLIEIDEKKISKGEILSLSLTMIEGLKEINKNHISYYSFDQAIASVQYAINNLETVEISNSSTPTPVTVNINTDTAYVGVAGQEVNATLYGSDPITLWRKKLKDLQKAYAMTSDASTKFKLQYEIQECLKVLGE
jgi:hypothetical protein